MKASTKALSLSALAGSNWSLGIVTEVKRLEDRVVVKLADGSFRQAVLKTATAVRGMRSLTVQKMYDDMFARINTVTAFCAADYNGRPWNADRWFVGAISGAEYGDLIKEASDSRQDLDTPF